jgi:hypothetical protein
LKESIQQPKPLDLNFLLQQPQRNYAQIIRASKDRYEEYFNEFRAKDPNINVEVFKAYFESVRASPLSFEE